MGGVTHSSPEADISFPLAQVPAAPITPVATSKRSWATGFLGPDSGDGEIAVGDGTGPGSQSGIMLDSVMTGEARKALEKYTKLNKVQSVFFDSLYGSNDNAVVAGPTGVGKTLAAELAFLRMLGGTAPGADEAAESATSATKRSGKMVYLAPSRALCIERASDWSERFEAALGVKVECLPSDFNALDSSNSDSLNHRLARADLVCTTPEKWDSVTRRWRSNADLIGEVAVVCIDEVHTLSDDRGATLEAVVARMRTIASSTAAQEKNWPCTRLRLVALSATLPNVNDVGAWLRAPAQSTF